MHEPRKRLRVLGMTVNERRDLGVGLLYCSPFLIGFLGLTLYPMLASFYYSFTHFDGLNPPRWIGLNNYKFLLENDDIFRQALANTIYMVVLGVPLQLLTAFLTALLLTVNIRGQSIYRGMYILPAFLPAVPVGFLWTFLFNGENGIVNLVLGALHLPEPGWFTDPSFTKPALILFFLWTIGTTTIIYMAALQAVPTHLYESAELDGAGRLRRLWHITLPMTSPASVFNLITCMIGTFQIFAIAYVIGGVGGPQGSLMFYILYIWQNAFTFLRFGYASAMAWILFLIIMVCTAVLMLATRRLVYYEGDTR